MANDKIIIHGARAHNLKNIDVTIPRDKLVVITGLSGSGKSSLAFDTLYAEGQRRYVESLSAYARQFLGQMQKPDVDSIDGLSPAISIDQKTTSKNPRSTVGTVTEINDYLRLLWARVGHPICPNDGTPIQSQSVDQMVARTLALPEGSRIQIMSPIVRQKKGTQKKEFARVKREGYVRLRVDGETYDVSEAPELDKNKKHDVDIVVDRIVVRDNVRSRLFDSLEAALRLSDGYANVDVIGGEPLVFSEHYACPICGFTVGELEPRLFSFNAPFGACPDCDGLGMKLSVDPDLVVPDDTKTLREGAIAPWNPISSQYYPELLAQAAAAFHIDLDTPFKDLPKKDRDLVMNGSGGKEFHFHYENDFGGVRDVDVAFEGVLTNIARRYRDTNSDFTRDQMRLYMTELTCPTCHGKRLNRQALSVKVSGEDIAEVSDLSIKDALPFFKQVELSEQEAVIAKPILKEVRDRLTFLRNVGLDYLTLSRAAGTLSGGEAQRIRLATQIGSNLSGVLYILDEPSIGLHQRDNDRLISSLKKMRDLGNTLIVVEHDEDTMRAADYLIDIGPGAGEKGGEVMAAGTPAQVAKNPKSLTGQYLAGKKFVPVPLERRNGNGKKIRITGAAENNLKDIDVDFPLGKFIVVTGVSGSGKSTLVNQILKRALAQKLNHNSHKAGKYKNITGYKNIDKLVDIDQSPIGRTPRSNPATYTSVFDDIRDLFAKTNEAKIRGYSKGRFSFNVKGGRCETCKGDGIIRIEMNFLPDIYVPCEVCHGTRYNSETLEVTYHGKNIAQVLDMTVAEALDFFKAIPKITRKLQTIVDVGLGYVKMGQPATTLSGGEAQRMKLASELYKKSTGSNFYILDEPTTGLHTDDIKRLLTVLQRLVDEGNTVLIIEHNLDVVKSADWLIDLGPEGGDGGGTVIATGTPEHVATVAASYTGQYLGPILDRDKARTENAVAAKKKKTPVKAKK
ncbi:excinuclease ABC subunit UvrA [Schleiferilactobacillus harbinensis]|jgi:excinuclease ABC subunit A|uniref:UvrABC system protein A n=2 Tax=Schleiferilactobacillus harbinensis TaxID=304207 RepID=A0A510TS83_9LACO|nr:excinuclease ABC subunit UvrA [Schleiferilactobacillus harbinensis]KRM29327.1 uvrA1 protein [Schleiferilactobacillus harbinensis DSM 16991]MCI1782470.1 excinuclease ABC subunit UvrA [Schleiferilactobacillus harbinensis]MCI1850660.1 excinuclease ABC subunit UvrA [Schleiferilactobacillus harbinensis]QFR22899.1 excinuclease ABC subunit UvrA [Schleiferilactobacillus harbinensis]QFR64413.1 excinuclease ABC subunit UvrA [Schleiferilactobacillus harbinensis]